MSVTYRPDLIYTALFCEENIWHLANSFIQQGISAEELSVIYISNKEQKVAVFNQKSCEINQPIIWDYHVLLLRKLIDDYLIYDFDSRANFPTLASEYLDTSFPANKHIPEDYQPDFRLIDSETYLKCFHSDRSHMKDIVTDELFPAYPILIPENHINAIDLKQLIDIETPLNIEEKIFNLSGFKEFISKNK